MPDKLAVRACVFDAFGTLFDLASAAARCNDVLGDKTAAVATLWREKQITYTWLRGDAEPARRLLAGDRRRARLHAGDARHLRPRRARAPDGPLPQARSLPRGAGHAAPPEGRGLRHRHPVEWLARHAAGPRRQRRARRSCSITCLSVEEVGVFKPHPSVYQLAVDRLGVPANQISLPILQRLGCARGVRVRHARRLVQPLRPAPRAPARRPRPRDPYAGGIAIAGGACLADPGLPNPQRE